MTSPKRLLESGDAMGKLLGRAKEGGETARPGSRDRVWRALSSPRAKSSAGIWVPALAAAAVAIALFIVKPWEPSAKPDASFARVALASGDVQAARADQVWSVARAGETLPEGSQLKTAEKSRAYTRLAHAGALFHEGTRATLKREGGVLGIALGAGAVVAAVTGTTGVTAGGYTVEVDSALFETAVAADAVTSVSVREGTVRVRGPATDLWLHAGDSWSSRSGLGHATLAPGDAATARALAQATTEDAVLRIARPVGAQITFDGVDLGTTPIEVLAKPGMHELVAMRGSLRSTAQTLVVAKGGEAELTEPQPPPLPEVTFEPAPPAPVPETHPARVDPPADPSKRYMLARSLAQKGRAREALALYEGLARGTSGWAEPSQYEVGHLELRALKDAAAAERAFTDYRRRFPQGTLAHEVALSSIEVQLKLGDADNALSEMDDFLTRFPASERRHDVRFVRATVRRDRGDCAGATDDYLLLFDTQRHADDALYFAAVCEQQSGRTAIARRHLADYLQRFPSGAHSADVKRFFEGAPESGNSP